MPILSAMARTTVGPAPVNRPPMPSSFTIRDSALPTPCSSQKQLLEPAVRAGSRCQESPSRARQQGLAQRQAPVARPFANHSPYENRAHSSKQRQSCLAFGRCGCMHHPSAQGRCPCYATSAKQPDTKDQQRKPGTAGSTHGVVAALLSRQLGVCLHADEGQIRGRAHQGTQATGRQAAHSLLPQRQGLQGGQERTNS
jgi:hypothetical protein